MSAGERLALRLLRLAEPERAHGLALRLLRAGLGPRVDAGAWPRLATRFAGLELPNPLGLAAGFDKNAEAVDPLLAAGFGFVEVGAVTPRPQPGNPRPRLFRLPADGAVINRFGFNNDGMDAVARRLDAPRRGIVGVNLGANKASEDKAADYAVVMARLGRFVDFATVNVSSPNTAGLRDLQAAAALGPLLARVQEANAALPRPVPLLVKIAPDIEPHGLDAIVAAAEAAEMSGIVATNTTLARDGLRSANARQAGGLSGRPLKGRAQEVLARLRTRTALPLMGAGGIADAADARARLAAGAGALQLYTALVYHGLGLVPQILGGLDAALAAEGHATRPEAGAAPAARSSAG